MFLALEEREDSNKGLILIGVFSSIEDAMSFCENTRYLLPSQTVPSMYLGYMKKVFLLKVTLDELAQVRYYGTS